VALICDTGPLLAALDRDDPDHNACASLLAESEEDLLVPGLVLAELNYWCRKIGLTDAWLTFLEDVESGAWRLAWPFGSDVRRARELEQQYATLDLGIVDASIIALAERLNEPKLATLDYRHFTAVRPLHVPALRLLPEL
jgi:predicted nucleic acid-binding protein